MPKPVFVGMPEPKKGKKGADKTQEKPVQPKPRKKGLLYRVAEIVSDDVNYYLHGIRSEKRQKWEDFEKFCELSRGKK
jgi:hypothetical protein